MSTSPELNLPQQQQEQIKHQQQFQQSLSDESIPPPPPTPSTPAAPASISTTSPSADFQSNQQLLNAQGKIQQPQVLPQNQNQAQTYPQQPPPSPTPPTHTSQPTASYSPAPPSSAYDHPPSSNPNMQAGQAPPTNTGVNNLNTGTSQTPGATSQATTNQANLGQVPQPGLILPNQTAGPGPDPVQTAFNSIPTPVNQAPPSQMPPPGPDPVQTAFASIPAPSNQVPQNQSASAPPQQQEQQPPLEVVPPYTPPQYTGEAPAALMQPGPGIPYNHPLHPTKAQRDFDAKQKVEQKKKKGFFGSIVGTLSEVTRQLNQGISNSFSHWDVASQNRMKVTHPDIGNEPFFGEFHLHVTHLERPVYGTAYLTSKHVAFTGQNEPVNFELPIADIVSIQLLTCTLSQPPSTQPGVIPPKTATWSLSTTQQKPNSLQVFTNDHKLHHFICPSNFDYFYGILDFLWRNPQQH